MQQARKNKKADESESSSDEDEEPEHQPNEMKDEAEEDHLQALENSDNLLLKYDLDKEHFHFEDKKVNLIHEQRNLRKQKEH